MSRAMKLDKDGRLAVPEADVQRTCIDWMKLAWGYRYISTNASDRKRNGRPAHECYTLDGLFIEPAWKSAARDQWIGFPVVFVEWKRRDAKTDRARREGQEAMAQRLRDAGFLVIRMPDKLREDPIQWFKTEVMRLL